MNDELTKTARSILVGVIGLVLTSFIFVVAAFFTHDEPLIGPSLVMLAMFAGIVIYEVGAFRRKARRHVV